MAPNLLKLSEQFMGKQKYLQLPKHEDVEDVAGEKNTCVTKSATIPWLIISYVVLLFWTVALILAMWYSFTFGYICLKHSLQIYCMCSEIQAKWNFIC